MKLSIVIPTYNEKDNIEKLLFKLNKELVTKGIDGEVIIVDDNSEDGTGKIAEKLKKNYLNLEVMHREEKLGLSSAVLLGWEKAQGEILCAMDGDLSHSPETIGKMYNEIVNGADLVIGSRYAKGGKIKDWNLFRKFSSKIATLFARIFTNVSDPMSGFFMMKKETIDKSINPKGYKILLEILVKLKFSRIVEVPIIFVNRKSGKSKFNLEEIIFYFLNLLGYLSYKKNVIREFLKFSFVGLLGTLVNILSLYFFTEDLNQYYLVSAFFSFIIAATLNYILNKIWTFKERFWDTLIFKYIKFLGVSAFSLATNLIFLYIFTEYFEIYYLISQGIAIGIAFMINFIGNKIWTFRK